MATAGEMAGLRCEDAGAGCLGAVAPAVDLLEGLDKDAFAHGRHAKPGNVEVGDVRFFAALVRQHAEEAVMVHIGNARALGAGTEDEHGFAAQLPQLKFGDVK